MTMTNVIAGFRTTGICPLNRRALLPSCTPSKFNPSALCKGAKLKFIPVYSPAKKVPVSSPCPSSPVPVTFSEKELARFQHRYDEGYDLTHNVRYNLWVEMYHPESQSPVQDPTEELCFSDDRSSPSSAMYVPPAQQAALKHSTVLSKMLTSQQQVIKIPKVPSKTSARVLTSTENLMNIAEKERRSNREKKSVGQKEIRKGSRKNLQKPTRNVSHVCNRTA